MSAGSLRGSGHRYTQLVAEALQLTHLPQRTPETMQRAENNLRQAIALCPERRDGHGILAQLVVVKDHNEASLEFMRTIDLSIRHDELWAKSVVTVFEHFQSGELGPSSPPRPAWWADETLKSWAVEATQILPEFEWRAVRMLAIVMSAPVYPWRTWEPGERSADELRTAAASFQSVLKLVGQARKGNLPVTSQPEYASLMRIRDADAKLYIELALQCRKMADGIGGMTTADRIPQQPFQYKQMVPRDLVPWKADGAVDADGGGGSSGGGGAAPPSTEPAKASGVEAAPSE